MPIQIVITDDHPMLVEGLVQALKSSPEIEVMNSYTSGEDLLEAFKTERPDVLLLDLQLPGISGKELVINLIASYPSIRILILSGNENPLLVEEMLHAGCSGYIYKSRTDTTLLVKAIEHVHVGEIFLEEDLKKQLLTGILKTKKKAEKASALLTRKEKEIMEYVVNGFTNQAIAELLHISIRTVESHRSSLLQKLGVKNTVALVKKAIELRMI